VNRRTTVVLLLALFLLGAAAKQNVNPNTNLGYLFAIYIITWAGFFAYIFLVSRRQRELEREIRQLKALVDEKGKAAGSS
jgi:CcmD family protein